MKTATSLFDFIPGKAVLPPSDEDMKREDAKILDDSRLRALTEDIDTLCQRLKFLSHPSRLEAARHISKGVNSTTKMFNVAVFLRDKEEDGVADLFAPKAAKEEDLFAE